MSKKQIEEHLMQAMKEGNDEKRSILRMVLSTIRNAEIEKGKKDEGLSPDEMIQLLRTEVKKRKEAAAEFLKGNRSDLAEKEEREAAMLTVYLPPELTDDELIAIIRKAITETDATSEKDFGVVMKTTMTLAKGRVGGDRVSIAVREELKKL
ncbi:MAG: hypothetical protein COU90_01635 [Candidatus Ryanbacteria bacterium CG10_big_fil_rev_8_21_14_0_10_43_42]|uniref:Glutamyl-tRNA amidotransferase n=1 Tax=Candidatus Ryanbacteria bacterium CG10_big_fil_rev_8_21_14_0_10_43_42 TaxID=1974864 RepID=A0A2M8KX68_9BACT|nr:MAG: hypothetical protein COU90_01635 [Candidatus Ryanbacteria bacterium CG10_big_fil_rev_8_21_14_0_10_43_42]